MFALNTLILDPALKHCDDQSSATRANFIQEEESCRWISGKMVKRYETVSG